MTMLANNISDSNSSFSSPIPFEVPHRLLFLREKKTAASLKLDISVKDSAVIISSVSRRYRTDKKVVYHLAYFADDDGRIFVAKTSIFKNYCGFLLLA